MAITVVGSVALDAIATPQGAHSQLLGGSATYFALAACRLTTVHVIAAVGQDLPKSSLRILQRPRIDLEGLAILPGTTFRWQARYSDDLATRATTGLSLGVFESFQPHITARAKRSAIVCLANIDPRLQGFVLSQAGRPRLVAVDTIDHWISTQRDALLKLLRKTDVFFANEEEARLLTQAGTLRMMGARLRRLGPSVVLIKQGWYGAVGWVGGSIVWVPAYPVERTVDPTGAGDAFAGGLLGRLDKARRLDAAALREAMLYGSCLGSFCVEGIGVSGLQRLTGARFWQRLSALKRIAGVARI